MAKRLEPGEGLPLLVSPKSGHLYQGYGPDPLSPHVYGEAAECKEHRRK